MPLKKQDKPELLALITASAYKDSLVVKHYGDLTIQKAMNSQGMCIGRLEKTQGDDVIVPAIAKLFLAASLYFGEKFSQDMAEVVVRKMLAEYELRSQLKLEDLVVICKEIVETEQFGKFTANKLLAAIKKYQKRRERLAIESSMDSVAQTKLYGTNMHERIHDTLRKTAKDKSTAVDRTRGSVKKYYK